MESLAATMRSSRSVRHASGDGTLLLALPIIYNNFSKLHGCANACCINPLTECCADRYPSRRIAGALTNRSSRSLLRIAHQQWRSAGIVAQRACERVARSGQGARTNARSFAPLVRGCRRSDQVAGRGPAFADRPQLRRLVATAVDGFWTARVEPASGRRGERARRFAGER
jgi:hypothetical protein